jgi:Flp pilus assembly protein TadG
MNAKDAKSASRGSACVEVALLLPVVLAMLFGLIEVGNMYFAKATVAKAAQSGARFAVTGRGAVEGDRLALIEERSRQMADRLGADRVQVAVSSYGDVGASGEPVENNAGGPCELVQVRVSYAYDPITPFLAEALPSPINFSASERMVNEPWMPCD